jgi:hypothetical protein
VLDQDLIKDATKKSMILCGHITPPEDKGKYLAYAAIAQCPRISKTADESDVITIQEFYRFTLSGTANGQGKIAEMGAIQQVAKNYTQLRKVSTCLFSDSPLLTIICQYCLQTTLRNAA